MFSKSVYIINVKARVMSTLKCKVSSRETWEKFVSAPMYNLQINATSVLMYDEAETLYAFRDVEFKLLVQNET